MATILKKALIAATAATMLGGCAHLTTRSLPKADIGNYEHIFVEKRLADNFGVAEEISRQLREMGYDSSAGALTMMPSDSDLIVSYEDLWTWDFNTYMIELDMSVRSARTDKIFAVGHYNRPSMIFGRPPSSMIHELLVKLFKRG